MVICNICKDTIKTHSSLPCSHTFCFLCISLHLSKRLFCPDCGLNTNEYRKTDIIIDQIDKVNKQGILKYFKSNQPKAENEPMKAINSVGMSDMKIRKMCKKYFLNIGSRDLMLKRLKKYQIVTNLELKTGRRRNAQEIAEFVNNSVTEKRHLDLTSVIYEIKRIKDAFRK